MEEDSEATYVPSTPLSVEVSELERSRAEIRDQRAGDWPLGPTAHSVPETAIPVPTASLTGTIVRL